MSQPYFEYGLSTSPPGGTLISIALRPEFQSPMVAAYNSFTFDGAGVHVCVCV